ncbi:MAG: DUF362 domain-containing protein, partial [Proteobacteria bacterium]|nr:DUF362 domain-containing protein [Pseudomonadota bacterium]
HACILAMSEVVRPALTVVDGIYCIEGTGPTGPPVGEVKRMDLLVAGRDMMAVDNVCLKLMGIEVGEVGHLRSVEDIEVVGERVEEVGARFKRPDMALFKIDPFEVYGDDKTCTMCTVSFYKAVSKIFGAPELVRQLGGRDDLCRIRIVMGQSEPPAEMEGGTAVCIGDCSKKTAKRRGLAHIEGCHPDYREIVNHLFPGTYPVAGDAGTDG